MDTETLIKIIAFILSSAAVGTVLANLHITRLKRKELIAAATRSALRRVEIYYRIVRRTANESDAIAIRNIFHDVQEENDYYSSLLSIESVWLGESYKQFIAALKRETMPKIQEAWNAKPQGPGAMLQDTSQPDVKKYYDQFTKDSKRFFNPIMRVYMRLKYTVRKHLKSSDYGSQ